MTFTLVSQSTNIRPCSTAVGVTPEGGELAQRGSVLGPGVQLRLQSRDPCAKRLAHWPDFFGSGPWIAGSQVHSQAGMECLYAGGGLAYLSRVVAGARPSKGRDRKRHGDEKK